MKKLVHKNGNGWQTITAAQMMTSPVLSLQANEPIQEAAAFLIDHQIHGAPVVGPRGKVVGVLSLTDVARFEREREPVVVTDSDFYRLRAGGTARRGLPWEDGFQVEEDPRARVKDYMTPTVIAVSAHATLPHVVEFLLKHRVHRLMVVQPPSMKLVGVVTETDVLKTLNQIAGPGKKEATNGKSGDEER